MKKPDDKAVQATLARLDHARQNLCRGTAALERLREAVDHLDLAAEAGDHVRRLLTASLDRLYAGAAELQYVRPLVMGVVETCEILQGVLRRQLRAASKGEPDELPFPEGYFGSKKPEKKPLDGA